MTSEIIYSRKGTPYRVSRVPTNLPDRILIEIDAGGLRSEFSRVGAERLAEALLEAARGGIDPAAADSASWTGVRPVKVQENDTIHITGVTSFIEAFQRAMKLRIDGVVGPETIAALKRLAEGRADRPASAGDIDTAVDRILSAVANGEPGNHTEADRLRRMLGAAEVSETICRQERDAARGDAAREKAAAADLATRLDKTEREWRAEQAARRAIQDERGRLTVEARERQRILEQTEAERDQARKQRDDYKRRLDTFEATVRGDMPYLYQGQIGDVALIPGGHWRITHVRATSSGEYRIEMEPVDG